jgi:hypothetical protein
MNRLSRQLGLIALVVLFAGSGQGWRDQQWSSGGGQS